MICALNCGSARRKVVKKERSFCGYKSRFSKKKKSTNQAKYPSAAPLTPAIS
jgi:hypothetical protein